MVDSNSFQMFKESIFQATLATGQFLRMILYYQEAPIIFGSQETILWRVSESRCTGPTCVFGAFLLRIQTGSGESLPVLLNHLEVQFGSESCIKSTYQSRKATRPVILRGAK